MWTCAVPFCIFVLMVWMDSTYIWKLNCSAGVYGTCYAAVVGVGIYNAGLLLLVFYGAIVTPVCQRRRHRIIWCG